MNKPFILVGPDPMSTDISHPGGQLTAATGLMEYAIRDGHYDVCIIDTLQCNFPLPSLMLRLKKGIARVFNLFKKLKKDNIEGVIIFSNSSGFGFYERILMSLICRLCGVAHIVLIRDSMLMLNGRFLFLTQFLLKIPHIIGVQGDLLSDFYQNFGVAKSKIKIIRNWLPIEYSIAQHPKSVLANSPIRFIFVGWLIKEKGILNLLYAIERLLKDYDFEFIIVGGGTLESYVKNKINNSIMKNKIRTTGWLSNLDVQHELERSHVFVLPSETEGFPNVIIEAMAKGLPIIATNVGGISDSVRSDENGYLIDPNKPDQLIGAMKKYILNFSLVAKHSIKSLEVVKLNHDKESNCRKVFDVFK